jgi:hypothetical protein
MHHSSGHTELAAKPDVAISTVVATRLLFMAFACIPLVSQRREKATA